MSEDNLTTLDHQPEILANIQGKVINLNFKAAEKDISFPINIMANEVTLSDIVIPARKLSSKIAVAHREMLARKGEKVPCRKGCCSCCSSLIPMSLPEVFRLSEEFAEMPEDKNQRLLRDCIDSAQKILKKAGEDNSLHDFANNDKSKITELNEWYSELGIECPFLSKRGLCKIYEQRPLACREHIVTGTSKLCQKDTECKPKVVPIEVSVLETLGQLTSEIEGKEIEAIMLPFSLAWAQDNRKRAEKKWPAEKMVRRFAEIIQHKAVNNQTQINAVL
jgi:Fe-S-cluster containining protein